MERAEKIGLGVAAGGHVVLFGVLSFSLISGPDDAFRNKPIEVMIADEVGLESAAPNPSKVTPATSVAPELGLPEESSFVEPEPLPQAPPTPQSKPREAVKPAPTSSEPRRRPDKPTSSTKQKPASSAKPKGSRLGKDFLKGVTDSPSINRNQNVAAEKASPAVVASLQREVLRQLKPHWQRLAPSGADAELLRTELRFRLDKNGKLVGTPQNLGTTGRTASNAPQVGLHSERAIRAVRLASPFQLPAKYYDAWKDMKIGFDKRLSQ